MYEYRATVVKVVDGDTVRLRVDLGFFLSYEESFRLFGVDTPETKGATREAGLKAKEFVEKLLPPGTLVSIRTTKADKYGRWLAEVFLDVKLPSVNARLVELGLAKSYFGGKKE